MLQMQRPRPKPGGDKSLTIFVVFGYCVGESVFWRLPGGRGFKYQAKMLRGVLSRGGFHCLNLDTGKKEV